MEALYFPNENDFRRWIAEAVQESLEKAGLKTTASSATPEEPLLSRKDVAGLFRISLVTLHDWMNRGLPCHKQRGRVFFIRTEVMEYIRKNDRKAR